MGDPFCCTLCAGFLYGALGGFFVELKDLFKFRHEKTSPSFLRSVFYWIVTPLMIAAGGVVVCVYIKSNFCFKPIIAVNIGASAPLIFETFISKTPRIEPGKVD